MGGVSSPLDMSLRGSICGEKKREEGWWMSAVRWLHLGTTVVPSWLAGDAWVEEEGDGWRVVSSGCVQEAMMKRRREGEGSGLGPG